MEIIVRPIEVNDARPFHRISTQESVLPYMNWLPSLRVEQVESMIKNLGPTDHIFVAILDGNVVGYVALTQSRAMRKSHNGELYIGVDSEFHGNGIGSLLLNKALELADQWLMLERVELEVLETNPRAQALYERFGFVVEGRKKGAFRSSGKYVDMICMTRFRPDSELLKK